MSDKPQTSRKPGASKQQVDLRDEHTKVLVRRLLRDYISEHKGRIGLALLGIFRGGRPPSGDDMADS